MSFSERVELGIRAFFLADRMGISKSIGWTLSCSDVDLFSSLGTTIQLRSNPPLLSP